MIVGFQDMCYEVGLKLVSLISLEIQSLRAHQREIFMVKRGLGGGCIE